MDFKPGDKVTILSGRYAGQIGTVEGVAITRTTIAVRIPLADRRLVLAYIPRSLTPVPK